MLLSTSNYTSSVGGLDQLERGRGEADRSPELSTSSRIRVNEPVLGAAPPVVDDVAHRELDPVVVGDQGDHRLDLGVLDPVLRGRPAFQASRDCARSRRRPRPPPCSSIVRARFQSVPYLTGTVISSQRNGKSAGVVEDRLLEDEAVGDPHDAAVVEVALDPLADLHQGGAQHADVDDVALDAAELDAVAGR